MGWEAVVVSVTEVVGASGLAGVGMVVVVARASTRS